MTEQPADRPPPPTRDPWKGLRGVMAGTMIIEAIVVMLALPVVAKLGAGISSAGGFLMLGLVVAMLVTSGLFRYRWAIGLALALQLVMIAGGFVVTALGVLGVLFALVWIYFLWLRHDVAQRMAKGRLPGQR